MEVLATYSAFDHIERVRKLKIREIKHPFTGGVNEPANIFVWKCIFLSHLAVAIVFLFQRHFSIKNPTLKLILE